MSDLSSSAAKPTGSPKKRVSPARNVIGLVVLLVVLAAGWFQYSAVLGYNAAVKALAARMNDEEKDLLSDQEATSLFGKSPDAPGTDVKDGTVSYTKKTYTWRGPLKSYTLTAFFTKGADPGLHHYEPEGAKYTPPPPVSSKRNTTSAEAPGKSRGQGPTKAAAPVPTKATAPVPTKTTEPAPAKTTEPAPAKTTEPAPAKTTEPAPAKTTEPAPANRPK